METPNDLLSRHYATLASQLQTLLDDPVPVRTTRSTGSSRRSSIWHAVDSGILPPHAPATQSTSPSWSSASKLQYHSYSLPPPSIPPGASYLPAALDHAASAATADFQNTRDQDTRPRSMPEPPNMFYDRSSTHLNGRPGVISSLGHTSSTSNWTGDALWTHGQQIGTSASWRMQSEAQPPLPQNLACDPSAPMPRTSVLEGENSQNHHQSGEGPAFPTPAPLALQPTTWEQHVALSATTASPSIHHSLPTALPSDGSNQLPQLPSFRRSTQTQRPYETRPTNLVTQDPLQPPLVSSIAPEPGWESSSMSAPGPPPGAGVPSAAGLPAPAASFSKAQLQAEQAQVAAPALLSAAPAAAAYEAAPQPLPQAVKDSNKGALGTDVSKFAVEVTSCITSSSTTTGGSSSNSSSSSSHAATQGGTDSESASDSQASGTSRGCREDDAVRSSSGSTSSGDGGSSGSSNSSSSNSREQVHRGARCSPHSLRVGHPRVARPAPTQPQTAAAAAVAAVSSQAPEASVPKAAAAPAVSVEPVVRRRRHHHFASLEEGMAWANRVQPTIPLALSLNPHTYFGRVVKPAIIQDPQAPSAGQRLRPGPAEGVRQSTRRALLQSLPDRPNRHAPCNVQTVPRVVARSSAEPSEWRGAAGARTAAEWADGLGRRQGKGTMGGAMHGDHMAKTAEADSEDTFELEAKGSGRSRSQNRASAKISSDHLDRSAGAATNFGDNSFDQPRRKPTSQRVPRRRLSQSSGDVSEHQRPGDRTSRKAPRDAQRGLSQGLRDAADYWLWVQAMQGMGTSQAVRAAGGRASPGSPLPGGQGEGRSLKAMPGAKPRAQETSRQIHGQQQGHQQGEQHRENSGHGDGQRQRQEQEMVSTCEGSRVTAAGARPDASGAAAQSVGGTSAWASSKPQPPWPQPPAPGSTTVHYTLEGGQGGVAPSSLAEAAQPPLHSARQLAAGMDAPEAGCRTIDDGLGVYGQGGSGPRSHGRERGRVGGSSGGVSQPSVSSSDSDMMHWVMRAVRHQRLWCKVESDDDEEVQEVQEGRGSGEEQRHADRGKDRRQGKGSRGRQREGVGRPEMVSGSPEYQHGVGQGRSMPTKGAAETGGRQPAAVLQLPQSVVSGSEERQYERDRLIHPVSQRELSGAAVGLQAQPVAQSMRCPQEIPAVASSPAGMGMGGRGSGGQELQEAAAPRGVTTPASHPGVARAATSAAGAPELPGEAATAPATLAAAPATAYPNSNSFQGGSVSADVQHAFPTVRSGATTAPVGLMPAIPPGQHFSFSAGAPQPLGEGMLLAEGAANQVAGSGVLKPPLEPALAPVLGQLCQLLQALEAQLQATRVPQQPPLLVPAGAQTQQATQQPQTQPLAKPPVHVAMQAPGGLVLAGALGSGRWLPEGQGPAPVPPAVLNPRSQLLHAPPALGAVPGIAPSSQAGPGVAGAGERSGPAAPQAGQFNGAAVPWGALPVGETPGPLAASHNRLWPATNGTEAPAAVESLAQLTSAPHAPEQPDAKLTRGGGGSASPSGGARRDALHGQGGRGGNGGSSSGYSQAATPAPNYERFISTTQGTGEQYAVSTPDAYYPFTLANGQLLRLPVVGPKGGAASDTSGPGGQGGTLTRAVHQHKHAEASQGGIIRSASGDSATFLTGKASDQTSFSGGLKAHDHGTIGGDTRMKWRAAVSQGQAPTGLQLVVGGGTVLQIGAQAGAADEGTVLVRVEPAPGGSTEPGRSTARWSILIEEAPEAAGATPASTQRSLRLDLSNGRLAQALQTLTQPR